MNKAVVQNCALCWLFLPRIIMSNLFLFSPCLMVFFFYFLPLFPTMSNCNDLTVMLFIFNSFNLVFRSAVKNVCGFN
jgi:hypothetical protein